MCLKRQRKHTLLLASSLLTLSAVLAFKSLCLIVANQVASTDMACRSCEKLLACAQAISVFHEMMTQKCERSVITFSSLISACEKAGNWQMAVRFFGQMHEERCQPNTVTFNSLITACAQGAPWPAAP